jgi:tape measure domain-containing protein
MSNEAVLGFIIDVRDKFSGVFSKFNSSVEKMKKEVSSVSTASNSFMQKLNSFGKSFYTYVALPLAAVGAYIYKVGNDFETLERKLRGLTGSAKNAEQILNKIKSIKAPINISELGKGAQLLANEGLEVEKINTYMEQLATITSVTKDNFEDVAWALSQVYSKGKLNNLLFKQFGNVPIYKELLKMANAAGYTEEQLDVMLKKGQVTFWGVAEAIRRLQPEYQILSKEVRKTLPGAFIEFHNIMLKYADSTSKTFAGVSSIGEAFYKINQKLNTLLPTFTKWIEEHKQLVFAVAQVVALTAAFAALAVVLNICAIAMGVIFFPFTLIAGAIMGLTILYNTSEKWRKVMDYIWQGIKEATLDLIEFGKLIIKIISVIIAPIKWLFEGMGKLLLGTANFAGNFLGNAWQTAGESIPTHVGVGQENKSSIDININAPPGVVQSTRSTEKNVKFNLGENLAMAFRVFAGGH